MKISQIELFSVVAIILYIVFFAHSPPYMLRNALGNVFVAGTVFAVLTYITLYHNQTIGVMLILAFLMTMTQVTEHLTGDGPSSTQQGGASGRRPREPASPPPAPTNIPTPPAPPASSTSNTASMPPTGTTMDQSGNIVDSTGKVIQPAGSAVTATATTAAAPAQSTTTPVAAAATRQAPTAPANKPVAETPPAPVMSCNIESFAPF